MKQRAQPRREHLVDTAFQLFNEFGYHATGIDIILETSKVSKATMYKHFKSKDDLVVAVLQRRNREVIEQTKLAMNQAAKMGQDPLLAVFDMLYEWFRSDTFHGCNFIKAAGEFTSDHQVHQFTVLHKEQIRSLLKEYIEDESEQIKNQKADILTLLINGAIVSAQLHDAPNAALDAKKAAMLILSAQQ